jgi:hypothetical protein
LFAELEIAVAGLGEGFLQVLDGLKGLIQREGLVAEEVEAVFAAGGMGIGITKRGSAGLAPAFQNVVQAQGAEGIDEAQADVALGDGLALGVNAGDFINVDVAHRAGRQDALGAGDIEGAGFIEAVEGIDADDPGEDAAFFFE